MSDEKRQKLKDIFAATLEQKPEERRQFILEKCSNDETLQIEVESLLSSFEDAGNFMETPAIGEVAELIVEKEESDSLKNFAHYKIIRQIGLGGMGEVYLAQDKKLDRQVAIKILNQKFAKHKSNLERFKAEAKAASALNHPNILVIHEIGESEDSNYIVSEFVEGKTLREAIGKTGLKLSEILDITIQIANALTAAHSARIVHRDIKPENIMIRPDGYIKVLDFGLAKLVEKKRQSFIKLEETTLKENQTAKGVILGTVNYMSPEQAKGEKVDERTDIFSLGTVIYEMITGKTPFAGDLLPETFANLINKDPQPLSRFSSNVPDELERIVAKTLKKNKNERYQTMKDLLTDLKNLQKRLEFESELKRTAPSNEQAENKTQFFKVDTGEIKHKTGQIKRSKSIVLPILIVLIISAIGLGYYFFLKQSPFPAGKRSLAVLPFINTDQVPDYEYLSEGITESIINNLSQLSDLKVMSRNSAFRFRDNQNDLKSIASQLGVETVVTGEIKQLGDKLIINIRLIDGNDSSQIWGNQYVKTSADILVVQNEIARAVANNLRLALTTSEQQKLAKNYTENSDAYQLYLRGRFHVFKLTPSEVNKGISYFQQAIEIDPNYALAYVGIADAYRSLALGGEMLPTEFLSKSNAAANKAIEIDNTLSQAHTTLGMTIFWGEWDWSKAENQYKRALELNPNDPSTHLYYAHLLSNTGRHSEALTETNRAIELDPLFPFANALKGQFLLHAGKTDEALVQLQKTFELEPNFWMPHLFASSAYIEKKMYNEAITAANKATELSFAQTISIAYEGYALAKSGKQDKAKEVLNKLLKLSTERFVPPYHIALIYNGLGEKDKTFEWLEKGYEQHDPKMTFLKVEPKWDNLRSDARFTNLMKRIGFI